MDEPTCSQRDEGCPDCGVISTKVHAWVKQQVRDIPAGGDTVEVVVRKRRMVCAEPACGRQTFTQATEPLPARARCLTRLLRSHRQTRRRHPRAWAATADNLPGLAGQARWGFAACRSEPRAPAAVPVD